MKLQCQVEVINRLHSNLNIRTNGKYLKSTLALGKEPKENAGYFVIHFSTVNKTGTKYNVKRLSKVFSKCLKEGKTTLRFEDPPHDLCIKCEAIQLTCFMRLLKSCITGDEKQIQITPLSSLNVTQKEYAPTKLVISNRDEYPIKGLPRTLEYLYINGLNLCNFRRDILLLKQLTVLDLSNNLIEKLPSEFGRMPNLSELYLSHNQIGSQNEVDWRWLLGPNVSKKLKLLDISNNKLRYLPKSIWKLQRLVTFKLDNNDLNCLPATIGRIAQLRYLTISHNKLTSIPCSLLKCRLEYIDLSDNKFEMNETQMDTVAQSTWQFHSLVECASKVIIKQKIYYAPNIIPWTLVELLDNANACMCGMPVLNNNLCVNIKFLLTDYFSVVVLSDSRNTVTVQCYFCSQMCLSRYS